MSDLYEDGPMFEFGDQDYASAIGWGNAPDTKKQTEIDRKRNPRAYNKPEMLFSRPFNAFMASAVKGPPIEPLFGPFWQREELCILFASTGIGKSALAVQIGESLARGRPIAPFDNGDLPYLPPQKVLYLDFELRLTQLGMRYACENNADGCLEHKYDFSSEHLLRSEMYWNGHVLDGYNGFSDMFFTSIRDEINLHDAEVLIVDNITFLDRSSTSNTGIALSIMRSLSDLRQTNAISILVLAHTPKRYPWEPLTELDLQGSVNLANFADSMFAMGRSRQGDSLRYLKQIKVRSGRAEFGSDHVPVFTLCKFDNAAALGLVANAERQPLNNFLGMKFVGFSAECDHLAERGNKDTLRQKRNITERARRLAKQGKSCQAIASKLGVPKSTVHRYIKNA